MPDNTRAKAEDLFHRVIDLPPDEREAFLEAHSSDPKVRAEVEWLLGYAGETVDVEGGDLAKDFPVIADVRNVLEDAPAVSLAPNTRLGPYEVLAPIGAGGMGEVYRAKDTRLDREVAVKVLRGHMTDDPAALARFEREAKAIAALQHPNIVVIHDVGKSEGTPYVVTELLRGETLRARLKRSTPPWREVAQYGVAIAEGLSAAHERGVIHRDLKPENIFVTTDGAVKILDFGIARIGQAEASNLSEPTSACETFQTIAGTLLGTVHYMSPEQIQGRAADERSDIFSLGCVLHEALTGMLTFSGETFEEIRDSVLNHEPSAPGALGFQTSPGLDRVIMRCLQKESALRFQSAREVSAKLGQVVSDRLLSKHAVLAIVASAALVVAALIFALKGVTSRDLPLAMQLTDEAATQEGMTSWSPDGKRIAFAYNPEGHFDIYIMADDGSGEPTRLTSAAADELSPRWSPDPRYLAFVSGRGMLSSIYRIELKTGIEEKVADTGIHSVDRIDDMIQALGSNPWSPDGKELLYSRLTASGNIALFKVDIEAGAEPPVQVTSPDQAGTDDLSGSFVRGADWIVFERRRKGRSSLWKVTSTGNEVPLLQNEDNNKEPAPLSGGKGIVFRSDRRGTVDLWKLVLPSGELDQLTQGPDQAWAPSVSADGRIAFDRFTHQTHLFMKSVDAGNAPDRILQRPQDNFSPRFSADGFPIAYHSSRSGAFDIWLINSSLETTNLTNEPDSTDICPDWAPEGDRISFVSDRGGTFQLWTMKRDGSDPRSLPSPGLVIVQAPHAGVTCTPRWSPDRKLIGYLAAGEEGLEVWVVEPDGEGQPRLGHSKLRSVFGFDWYRDSQRVILVRKAIRGSGELEMVPLDLRSGDEGKALRTGFFSEVVVAPDGSALTYCDGESHVNMSLHYLSLRPPQPPGVLPLAGERSVIEARPGQSHVHNGDISPSAVVYTRDTDTSDLWILPAVP